MKIKKNGLKLQTRRKIYDFIKNNPGLHYREISRKTMIPKTTLNYHLNYMKKLQIIEIKLEGKYKYVYPKDKVGKHDKQILQLLRKKTPCLIFLHFLFFTFFSQKDLCKELGITSSKANYYIQKFLDMDILEEATIKQGKIFPYKHEEKEGVFFKRKPIGREIIYIRKNQEIIDDAWRIIITYKDTLPNKELIDTYIEYYEIWKQYNISLKESGIKLPRNRGKDDKFYDKLIELFKPPFAY